MAQRTINAKQRTTDPCIVPANTSCKSHTPEQLLDATLTRSNIPMLKNSTPPNKMGAYWSDKNERNKEYRDLPTNLTKKSAPQPMIQQDHLHLITIGQYLGNEGLKITLDKNQHNTQHPIN